ncbi:P4b precursor [Eastern grey kangaroopox virus]|uniref:Virion core protein 4b n=1 Tax=Eastern grey kangaroopox virus TaxID=2042482 RepID=A0A2C9DT70_9POXV|nr:P4b precursor [Eastern grey kangaroopox virus]ATI21203.1 P4b precursor [Eastern grey kangaroopox virus]ATX75110.1 P4b precursor [Eastern grey kangaroopox virus]
METQAQTPVVESACTELAAVPGGDASEVLPPVSDFLSLKMPLVSGYRNSMDLVGGHVHDGLPANTCNVCDTLAKLMAADTIPASAVAAGALSAGAKPPSRAPRARGNGRGERSAGTSGEARASTNPCKPVPEEKMISIDEIAFTQDWHLRLRRDGDAIVRYLNENKCDIRNFTMQDMINVMKKLNIVRNERQELFDLLYHVKGSLSSSSVSVRTTHPLILIYSHADERIGEHLRALDRAYPPSRYHMLISTTRFQSTNFVDMSSSSDIVFRYRDPNSLYFIHPIFVALFGVKLPALENVFVFGDSYSLMRQLHDSKKVKPENYMLLVNRLTEDSSIMFTGISDVISTEIQRANVHTMIRKLILNLRLGIFYCNDQEAVDNYLMKIIHTNSSQIMADEEQILASILAIVGFRPALVSVGCGGFGFGGVAASNFDVRLKPVPYIVVSPSRMITTMDNPIAINSRSVYALTFDGATGRVLFSPPNMSYQGQMTCRGVDVLPAVSGNNLPLLERPANAPVIVNGTLIYYVERRQNKNIIGGECFTGFRSVINDKPMDVSMEISINGILYRLRSAVCYKTNDPLAGGCEASDIFLKGYYCILFTEVGPWLYDPLSVFSKTSREARLIRVLKNQYYRETGSEDDAMFYDWMKEESSKRVCDLKRQQLTNHAVMFEDDLLGLEEAMSMVSRNCCILVYAQDYEPYLATKNISEIFS